MRGSKHVFLPFPTRSTSQPPRSGHLDMVQFRFGFHFLFPVLLDAHLLDRRDAGTRELLIDDIGLGELQRVRHGPRTPLVRWLKFRRSSLLKTPFWSQFGTQCGPTQKYSAQGWTNRTVKKRPHCGFQYKSEENTEPLFLIIGLILFL